MQVVLGVSPTVPYTERDPATGRPIPTEWSVYRVGAPWGKVGMLWFYPRTGTWLAYSTSGGTRLDGERDTMQGAASVVGWQLSS
jgi:hypothetical protein